MTFDSNLPISGTNVQPSVHDVPGTHVPASQVAHILRPSVVPPNIPPKKTAAGTLVQQRHSRLEHLALEASTEKKRIASVAAIAASPLESVNTVPKIIRQTWAGSRGIQPKDLMSMARNIEMSPNHKFELIVSNPAKIAACFEQVPNKKARELLMSRVELKSVTSVLERIFTEMKTTDIWKDIPIAELVAHYMGELDGPEANYAQASDFLRFISLWPDGGRYLDVDICLAKEMGDMRPKHGFKMFWGKDLKNIEGANSNVLVAEPRSDVLKLILQKFASNYKTGYQKPAADAVGQAEVRTSVANETVKRNARLPSSFLLKHIPDVQIEALSMNGKALEPYNQDSIAGQTYYKLDSEMGVVKLVDASGTGVTVPPDTSLSVSYSYGKAKTLPGTFQGPMDHVLGEFHVDAYKRSAIWELKRRAVSQDGAKSARFTVVMQSVGPTAVHQVYKQYIASKQGWGTLSKIAGDSDFYVLMDTVKEADASSTWKQPQGNPKQESNFLLDQDVFHYRTDRWENS